MCFQRKKIISEISQLELLELFLCVVGIGSIMGSNFATYRTSRDLQFHFQLFLQTLSADVAQTRIKLSFRFLSTNLALQRRQFISLQEFWQEITYLHRLAREFLVLTVVYLSTSQSFVL
jgi:hypothetical protein